MQYRGFTLDVFQEEAFRAVERGASVIAAAPTGSGKTLIAEYAIEKVLELGSRVIYTAPIKALSNQKYREFSARWPEQVGIVTGDVSLNSQAPVIIMTTEIFRNALFEDESRWSDVSCIIFDEVHFLDDPDRGTVWEESIIFAPVGLQIISLSATIANLEEIADWIRFARPGIDLKVVEETERNVPLEENVYIDGFGPRTFRQAGEIIARGPGPRKRAELKNIISDLRDLDRLPILFFLFSRRDCVDYAEESAYRLDLLDGAEKKEAAAYFDALAEHFDVVYDETVEHLRPLVKKGFAYHHAGVLPAVKEIIERLFEKGFIKTLFATETFALGVNMPARTVVFDTLLKKISGRTVPVKTRDYHQMAGRAGRRGKDEVGYSYVCMYPEEWEFDHVKKITGGKIEPIISRIRPSYSTLLKLYPELGDNIYSYLEKSLHEFQQKRRKSREKKKKGRKSRHEQWTSPKKLIKKRLQVLRAAGYLRGRNLTDKGRIAAGINGFEIQIAEIFSHKFYRKELREDALNVLFTSMVNEKGGRRHNQRPRRGPKVVPRWHMAFRSIEEFRALEEQAGISECVRPLNPRAWKTVLAFSRGADFEELSFGRGMEPGDLVRIFRLTIQLMKQTADYFHRDERFCRMLESAWQKLNRDVVDAENQLERSVDFEKPGRESDSE